jgi:radical SAM-linked protein
MIYRPVRERSAETLLVQAKDSLASTGYGNLSLLSLSTGDYGCIVPLMEQLIDQGASNKIAVSLPSLRAGTLTPNLMRLIKQIRKTGFTIAPEAGSQRLRNVINKNITEKDIYKTIEDAFRLGWQVVKLYFMVGLPTETKDDLNALVGLVKDLRKIKSTNGRRSKLNVSVAVFIPKPHTPFQWASQISLEESKETIAWVKAALKIPGVQVKWQNPEVSFLEGLWARGDRRLSRLLTDAYDKGCRFDGWSDKFRFAAWQAAISDMAIDAAFFTTRGREWIEPLPWDHIDTKVSKAFLKSEWERASRGELTSDCRLDGCHDCGVCDFATVEPIVFNFDSQSNDTDSSGERPERRKNRIQKPEYKDLEITYSKLGQAQYFGHLELQNIIVRAIRRSRIPVKYSEGFHPLPKISFEDPLPIGLESENELCYLTVSDAADPDEIKKRLNEHVPEGLAVTACRVAPAKSFRRKPSRLTYHVMLKDGFFDKKRLESFFTSPQWIYHRQNRRGNTQTINLREIVSDIKLKSLKALELTLRSDFGKTVRPSEVITQLFNLPDADVKQAKVVKVCTKNL